MYYLFIQKTLKSEYNEYKKNNIKIEDDVFFLNLDGYDGFRFNDQDIR